MEERVAARKSTRECLKSLANLRANVVVAADAGVRQQVIECERQVRFLLKLISERCQHCDKKIPFGCTSCASCADERGP